jgi:ComF family protein
VVKVLPQLATKLKGAALNLLFPQRCLGCGEEGSLLCRTCQKFMPRIASPICPKCGRPQPSGVICPGCIGWQNRIDGIRSPLKFEGLIREAIHQLKYKNLRSLSRPLASLLKDYLVQNPLPAQLLVPVPLHPKRLRERGYNQSFLLARELGQLLHLPVIDNCLVRTKYILPQAQTVSVDQRRENVKQAFTCGSPGLQGAQILLVDDVATSGATLDACAVALKSAGATFVWGLVLAREI